MTDLLVILALSCVVFALYKVGRNEKRRRRAAAATVELVIDRDGVRRRLADGREESAAWSSLVSVEVVCTPVTTADGARAFALLAEGPETGCLVPLGVGYDDDFVLHLSRLRGIRMEEYVAATEHKPPQRTIVWTNDGAAAS
ncbi:MAG: hypothetical protein U0Q22_07690 [Acidimicrobiales bacterium]